MNYIVIASHGRLASGMEDTVRFFNHSANIISLNAYSDDCHNFAEELAIILDDHRNDFPARSPVLSSAESRRLLSPPRFPPA